jgi:hypothetical protein
VIRSAIEKTLWKVRLMCWTQELVNKQSKNPASNGIERQRRNHVDCPAQESLRLHDGMPHCEFTHRFTLVHRVYR